MLRTQIKLYSFLYFLDSNLLCGMVTCSPLTSSFQYSIGIRQLVLIYVNILNLDRNYIIRLSLGELNA